MPAQATGGQPAAPARSRARQASAGQVPAQQAAAQPAVGAPARPARRLRVVPPQGSAGDRPSTLRRVRTTGPQPAVAPVPPGGRTGAPQRVRTTGPQPSAGPAQPAPDQQPQAAEPAKAGGIVGAHRTPFVMLLCGLLGGALVSALVISTTLAEGSFEISNLQNSTSQLAKQQQALQEQVAQAQSPREIQQRALQLGMQRTSELRYIDLATGKTTNTGPTWSGAANAPGYMP